MSDDNGHGVWVADENDPRQPQWYKQTPKRSKSRQRALLNVVPPALPLAKQLPEPQQEPKPAEEEMPTEVVVAEPVAPQLSADGPGRSSWAAAGEWVKAVRATAICVQGLAAARKAVSWAVGAGALAAPYLRVAMQWARAAARVLAAVCRRWGRAATRLVILLGAFLRCRLRHPLVRPAGLASAAVLAAVLSARTRWAAWSAFESASEAAAFARDRLQRLEVRPRCDTADAASQTDEIRPMSCPSEGEHVLPLAYAATSTLATPLERRCGAGEQPASSLALERLRHFQTTARSRRLLHSRADSEVRGFGPQLAHEPQ